jgi:acetyltransferase
VREPDYPIEAVLRDGTPVTIRPIRPDDAEREQAFVRSLSPESRYFRFMSTVSELSPELLERFTHPDPSREVALVALTGPAAAPRQIGVARCVMDADRTRGEFAIVVADALQGRGLGTRLMQELIRAVRARRLRTLEGFVLATNHGMLQLMQHLGFETHSADGDAQMRRVVLRFAPEAPREPR